MITVLFVDADNGSRSQMAEAFLNKMGEGNFIAFSAGLRKGYVADTARLVMEESGIDISKKTSNEVMNFVKMRFNFNYVITVCNEKELDQFAVLPSCHARLHWIFSDPFKFEGPEEEITGQYRQLRDLIKRVVKRFIIEMERNHSTVDSDLNFEPAKR